MIRALAALVCLAASPAAALICTQTVFDGTPYSYCEADPASDHISIVAQGADGLPYGTFSALTAAIGPVGMAMNAGMFHADLRPAGLFIENGETVTPLVTRAGPGNFGMLPNGVFCVGHGTAQVIETLTFAAAPPPCRYASQSGPMLVIDGALHPRFLRNSTSRYVRNGVGTTADGSRAVFVISDRPVSLYDFARFFRDGLGLPNALYFDGNVSRLYAPQLGRDDAGRPVGPMVVVAQ